MLSGAYVLRRFKKNSSIVWCANKTPVSRCPDRHVFWNIITQAETIWKYGFYHLFIHFIEHLKYTICTKDILSYRKLLI